MDIKDHLLSKRRRNGETEESLGIDAATLLNSNADEINFPTSRAMENKAVFRACLSAGLLQRAHKIFEDMRAESHAHMAEIQATDAAAGGARSTVEHWMYNAMLYAYYSSAARAETAAEARKWSKAAWKLFEDMTSNPMDSRPDAGTFATVAQGITRLEQLGWNETHNIGDVMVLARSSGFTLDTILASSVLQSQVAQGEKYQVSLLSPVAGDSPEAVIENVRAEAERRGDTAALTEIDNIGRVRESMGEIAELQPTLRANASGVEEKPFNLQTLQDSLAVMNDARMHVSDLYERQRWLEHSALDAARKRLQHDTEKLADIGLSSGGLKEATLQGWMWKWYQKLQERLDSALETLRKDPNANRLEAQLYPFLCVLPTSKLAMITVLELMHMQGISGVADGVKTTRALLQIGRAIENEYHAVVINKHPEVFVQARAAQRMLRDKSLVNFAARRDVKAWQERCAAENIETNMPRWTQTVRARVGGYLVEQLMDVAYVMRSAHDRDGELWEEEQPAFYSTYQYIAGKKLGVIRLNEAVAERLDRESVRETLHPRHLPMLVPPKPWLTHDSGGYFSVKTSAMRYKDSIEQNSYLRAASDNNGLEVVFAGLDVLGATAWRINREVFDVVLEVWNSGEEIADMPPSQFNEPEPQRPENEDVKSRSAYTARLRRWMQLRSANHSQRCDINYKLEIARSFLNERFYFPHNMDFRGRAYPIPSHLNHIGNDLCRGLLKFAEAKPLGKNGLRWMRIHLANVWGYDKASFQEREDFARSHEEQIRNSARDPLGGDRWWTKADDPWQCLATCIELDKALSYPEGPEAFPSQLPVHQDGTCNGLQHYAALGGDLQGAQQVNLRGGDRPSDVYSGVAELVINTLNERAAQGDEIAQLLQGKVTRKVVKQTVMTTVYGVTFVGAKNQVMRQLADRGDIPTNRLWETASYLAKVIMGCIGDLFAGANMIQTWLAQSARLIAKSIPGDRFVTKDDAEPLWNRTRRASPRDTREQMTSVIWTTALGLPVVQPYRKVKKHQVLTSIQTVFIRDPNENFEVNPSKQSSAFPPNFIHSLDATHMYLTAIECHSKGLVFASVHDSYWTHACDIDEMNDTIRDTFVRLHSQDLLKRLRDEFMQRYAGYKVPAASLPRTAAASPEELEAVAVAGIGAEAEADAVAEAKAEGTKETVAKVENDAPATPAGPKPKEGSRSRRTGPMFYELADLIPPIPEKGSFDVNEIKRSMYFFS
ncbi:DNA-directed RNA polymerase [Malassezia cuniculi]|uniref:DNA-directed RNA polymerase n=1 Tax=Malassezia cuniculi TaxID=948313 RepID=A0AAF0ET04_9BASI|nr:DNA-directed RNA polymerase [Malassezia cuniculi]